MFIFVDRNAGMAFHTLWVLGGAGVSTMSQKHWKCAIFSKMAGVACHGKPHSGKFSTHVIHPVFFLAGARTLCRQPCARNLVLGNLVPAYLGGGGRGKKGLEAGVSNTHGPISTTRSRFEFSKFRRIKNEEVRSLIHLKCRKLDCQICNISNQLIIRWIDGRYSVNEWH